LRSTFGALVICLLANTAHADDVCSFEDWAWHSERKQAQDYQTIHTTRDQLRDNQRHPELPCSVCREDQSKITLSNGVSVEVCHILAQDIEMALEETLQSGFEIQSLKGYRVGRTRGALDERGLRTEYSNHSFGVAVDINADANGLYDRCVEWGPECRLRVGGEWDPRNPLSVVEGNAPHRHMTEIGLLWGGALEGRQKDFMHFSLTGN